MKAMPRSQDVADNFTEFGKLLFGSQSSVSDFVPKAKEVEEPNGQAT